MKSLIFVVTLAVVANQLTRAAPAPETETKDAVAATPGVVDASPRVAEVKAEEVVAPQGVESASTWPLQDATKGPAVAAAKAQ